VTRPVAQPLPPGVKFWAWPRWRVQVGGRSAFLSPTQARLLALYLSEPGRAWTTADLVQELYGDREDGGPLNTQVTFFVTAKGLADRLRRHGIALDLERCGFTRRFRGLRAEGPAPPRPAPPPPAPPRPPPAPRPAARGRAPVPSAVLAAPWSFPERVEDAVRAGHRHPDP